MAKLETEIKVNLAGMVPALKKARIALEQLGKAMEEIQSQKITIESATSKPHWTFWRWVKGCVNKNSKEVKLHFPLNVKKAAKAMRKRIKRLQNESSTV